MVHWIVIVWSNIYSCDWLIFVLVGRTFIVVTVWLTFVLFPVCRADFSVDTKPVDEHEGAERQSL